MASLRRWANVKIQANGICPAHCVKMLVLCSGRMNDCQATLITAAGCICFLAAEHFKLKIIKENEGKKAS